MAGYNPQRARPRPVVAEDAPAPVDALLGATAAEPVVAPVVEPVVEPVIEAVTNAANETEASASPTVVAKPAAASTPVPEAPYVPTQTSAAERSRTRMLLLVAAGVTAAVVAVVLRRRRR